MSPEPLTSESPRDTWVRRAFVAWMLVLTVILVRGLVRPKLHSTFHYCRDAGLNWRARAELYQQTGETCRYSPLVHALLVPFTVPSEAVGAFAWRLASGAVFLAGLWWWSRAVVPAELGDGWRGLIVISTVPMAIGSIDNAQANPVMAGAMLAGVAAAATVRWNFAAACLAFACLFKIYPVALALLLMVAYPRSFGLRFVAAVALGLVLPFALQDPGYVARQYGNWFINLSVDERSQFPLYRAYRDFWLLIRVLHVPIGLEAYRMIQLGCAGGTAALVLWIRLRGLPGGAVLNTALGLACCWMTLLGPATESSTYILLAPAMGWMLADAWQAPRSLVVRGLVTSAFALFVAARFVGLFPWAAEAHAWGPHPLGALLLATAIVATSLNDALSHPRAAAVARPPAPRAA
jgi:hypothetical protein